MVWYRNTNYCLSFLYCCVTGYNLSFAPFIYCGTGIQIIVGSFYNAVRTEQKISFALFIMLWDRDTNHRLPFL